MSTKRTSAEPSSDEQTIEGSDCTLTQQEDHTKCARLASLSDTTLHDLPIELLEHILIKAITMEVNGLMLAKCVWKEKAGLVVDRLGSVCLLWNSILITNSFINRLYRALDDTAQKKIRLEILHQYPIHSFVEKVATMKDEMFMLCTPEFQVPFINVYDSDNIVHVKDIIPLLGILPVDIAGCSVSNCVYMLNKESNCHSVLRITRNEERRFIITPWLSDLGLSFADASFFVSINGRLIILLKQLAPKPSEVSIYNAAGSLQHAVTLFPAIHGFKFISGVIRKSNGNLVLATINDNLDTELREIDAIGRIVRQHRSRMFGHSGVIYADAHGRIMIAGLGNRVELLDSEFNLLDLTLARQNENIVQLPHGMHYNSERNEVVRFYQNAFQTPKTRAVTIFRFTGE